MGARENRYVRFGKPCYLLLTGAGGCGVGCGNDNSPGELNDIRLNDSVYINKAAKALITSLLCVDETMRLGYNDEVGHYHSIKQHPWFASINWDNVNAALYRPAIISPSLPSRREPG